MKEFRETILNNSKRLLVGLSTKLEFFWDISRKFMISISRFRRKKIFGKIAIFNSRMLVDTTSRLEASLPSLISPLFKNSSKRVKFTNHVLRKSSKL